MQESHLSNQPHAANQQPTEPANSDQRKAEPTVHPPDQAIQDSSEPGIAPESDLRQAIGKLQAELATANDKYIRLYAEFENFRKRAMQERIALIETAGEKLLQQFLPILDDFERALVALRQEHVSLKALEEGVELIHDKMIRFLEQAGVQPMLLEKGSVFDTAAHEAITKAPVNDPALHHKVIDVVEKGYMLKDKVLRYAKVIIGE